MDNHLVNKFNHYLGNTEAPWQYRRWALYSGVATMLGRRCFFPFGVEMLRPHMYIMLSGLSSARKGVAIRAMRELLQGAGYSTFAANAGSREKFLEDFQNGFASTTMSIPTADMIDIFKGKELDETPAYICAGELIEFLGTKNVPMLTTLTSLWDCDKSEYTETFRRSESICINQPIVNMIGGITPTNLYIALPAEIIGHGFLSRVIIVYSEPTKDRITFPPPLDPMLGEELIHELQEVKHLRGKFTFTHEAMELTDAIYKHSEPLVDARLQAYSGRRLTHLLKLSMVCAACRHTLIVDADCVEEANTVLSYTEEGMSQGLGELGDSKNAKVTQNVMNILSNSNVPVSLSDLYKGCMQDITKIIEFQHLLDMLARYGKIAQSVGADREMHYIIQKADVEKNKLGMNRQRWLEETR